MPVVAVGPSAAVVVVEAHPADFAHIWIVPMDPSVCQVHGPCPGPVVVESVDFAVVVVQGPVDLVAPVDLVVPWCLLVAVSVAVSAAAPVDDLPFVLLAVVAAAVVVAPSAAVVAVVPITVVAAAGSIAH